MSVDGFEVPGSDLSRTKAELEVCLTLIRTLGIKLETAINLQYLADLKSLTSGQADAFRVQLCEQLGLMAEDLVHFQASREKFIEPQ